MRKLGLLLTGVLLASCNGQQNKPESQEINELLVKNVERLTNDKVMCASDICVTENDLYEQRGARLYALEDKLFYSKYDTAREILIKKIIEKKLSGTGESFDQYISRVDAQLTPKDEEVSKFLKNVGVAESKPGARAFEEIRKHLRSEKWRTYHLNLIRDFQGGHDILVNLERKPRKQIANIDKLGAIPFYSAKNDKLKITFVVDPEAESTRNIVLLVQSAKKYFSQLGVGISWYFLPFSTKEEGVSDLSKIFTCSVNLDEGASYLQNFYQDFDAESGNPKNGMIKNNKVENQRVRSCVTNSQTDKNIRAIFAHLAGNNITKETQIIYGNEIEGEVPSVMELRDRINMKLRIKYLKSTSVSSASH